ncbi:MAG TPA: N-acyl homoserine lactonase family protein [Phototrophicaceae bacterium]|nr:N-acyl homoserine lactonase family protein [Phototrophicaceae bacterium]
MTGIVPQRLYLLQLGASSVPLPSGTLEMALGCYLVQMSDGTNILIDSGLPPHYAPPGMPPAAIETNVIAQLGLIGLQPADIHLLICSHFDIDHVGYNEAFPGAEVVVQRAEMEAARGGQPRFAAARPYWDHPTLRYRLVDGDTELLPGLTLLATSGHTPGHQSVLVRLPQTGLVLLPIDAVMLQRLFTPERPAGPGDDNAEQLRASTQKLLDLVEREQIALVVFGHDGWQWPTLKKAPEWYD